VGESKRRVWAQKRDVKEKIAARLYSLLAGESEAGKTSKDVKDLKNIKDKGSVACPCRP